ncbi:MAG: Calx-beta domain-containing protein [Actinomycetota bacterium]
MSRGQIMGAFVALTVIAGLVIVWQLTGEEDTDEAPVEILTDTVGRQTLRDELTLNGELRRDELSTINSPFDGRVSQVGISDGDEIAAGEVILSLDGRPAVAANGEFSFYRTLDVGSDGPDVLQLERILFESGYDPGSIDRLYTEATRAALRNWQIDYGYGGATPEPEETIIISLAPGNGYQVGDKDTQAILIGPSVPGPGEAPADVTRTITGSGGGAAIIPFQASSIPAIGVQITDATITEGDTLDVVLTADPAPVADTQIQLAFGGDATGGDDDDIADPDIDVDYLDDPLENSPIVWPAGATTVTLTLETFTDDVDEDDETWTINITPEQAIGEGINYNPAPLNTLTVTIEDATPDEIPTFQVTVESGGDAIDEGDDATYTITADRELGRAVEVRYSLTGTATEGDDYADQDSDPSFVFPAGTDETTVVIATVQDTTIEPTESLTLTLQASDDPTDEYLLGASISGTVRIEDEDEPELTIVGSEVRVAEGGAVAVTIRADEAPSSDISVDYSIGGTATMGTDYAVLTGTVTFPAGARQIDLFVQTLDDDVIFVPSDMIIANWPARVGTVFVDEGETVQLGQSLLTLTEPDFTITLFATPTDRSELDLGQIVTVELEAGNQELEGRIVELDDAAIITDSGTERYEGVVEVIGELAAVDGATVRVEVVLDERVDALVVPRAAIFQDATGNPSVRVIDPATLAQRVVAIETGIQEGSFTEVLSGLDGSEIIVVDVTGG